MVLALQLLCAAAPAPARELQFASVPSVPAEPITWLFSLQGYLTTASAPVPNGAAGVLTVDNVPAVVQFSDRPDRLAIDIRVDELATICNTMLGSGVPPNAVIQFTRSHGCLPANWVPAAGACDGSPLEALRRVHVCKDVRDGAGAAQWYCGVARHWDCRNSPRRRACGAAHYSERKEFFDRCMNHSVDAPCAAPPVEPAEHSDRRRGRLSGRVGDSRTLQPRSR
jgi:hypothetical protein